MRRSFLVLCIAAAFAVGACVTDPGATGAPGAESPGASPAAGSPAPGSPATSPGTASDFDPASVSGTVVFSGWQASPEEGAALETVLANFADGISQHHGRLPAGRRRLSGGDDREVQLG